MLSTQNDQSRTIREFTQRTKMAGLQRQIIPDFLFRQLPERGLRSSSLAPDLALFELRGRRHGDDAYFYRLFGHLALKALFQRQQSCMNGVLQANIIVVSSSIISGLQCTQQRQNTPLFQKCFRIDHVLANCACLPGPERTGGIHLV